MINKLTQNQIGQSDTENVSCVVQGRRPRGLNTKPQTVQCHKQNCTLVYFT